MAEVHSQHTNTRGPRGASTHPPQPTTTDSWLPKETKNGFRYFGPTDLSPKGDPLQRSLRVCVATSVRDIGCDDLANRQVEVDGSLEYMQGSLHALLDATKDQLRGIVEVVGVVVDDVEESGELERGDVRYSALPTSGRDAWIVPESYQLSSSTSISEITTSIPSSYRKLPGSSQQEIMTRARAKRVFEQEVENYASSVGADVILSDHLMIKLEHLFREGEFKSRVVNIHPAITWAQDVHQLRGMSPTKDAIERARTTGYSRTGASLHFISRELDAGPVICDGERTPVMEHDTAAGLTLRNYSCSKIPVMLEGLRYLAYNFYDLTEARANLMGRTERGQ